MPKHNIGHSQSDVQHANGCISFITYDFLLVFYSDLRSSWNSCQVISCAIVQITRKHDVYKIRNTLTELRFIVPLGTKPVISRMKFPANLLASTEKTKYKPDKTTTKIYSKPRLINIQKLQEHKQSEIHDESKLQHCCKQHVEKNWVQFDHVVSEILVDRRTC